MNEEKNTACLQAEAATQCNTNLAALSNNINRHIDDYALMDSKNSLIDEFPEMLKNAGYKELNWNLMPINGVEFKNLSLTKPDPIVQGLFDKNTKAWLMGASKVRKSFFLLQMALHIAAGFNFLNWEIHKKRKVLLVQIEIPREHYQCRFNEMCKAISFKDEHVKNLTIMNGRDALRTADNNIDKFFSLIESLAIKLKCELICIDPIFKFLINENSPEDWKPVLNHLDELCNNTGCAVVCVHHYPKGNSSSKYAVDRGSGSSIVARDMDCAIYLDRHKNEDLLVVESVQRCYPPTDQFSVEFMDGAFCLSQEAPVVRRQNTKNQKSGISQKQALTYFNDGYKHKNDFRKFLEKFLCVKDVSDFIENLVKQNFLDEHQGKRTSKYIGTPTQIKELKIKNTGLNIE